MAEWRGWISAFQSIWIKLSITVAYYNNKTGAVETWSRPGDQACAAQPAQHGAFQRGGIVARGVVARQQQAGQGGLLRRAEQVGRAAEGGALFGDDPGPLRQVGDAEFLAQLRDDLLRQLFLRQFLVDALRADDGCEQAVLPGDPALVEQPLAEAPVQPDHRVRQGDVRGIFQVHGIDRLVFQAVDLRDGVFERRDGA